MNVEVETALRMHKASEAQLIPIVVRSVEWSDSPLSVLQGLPKDARPVSLWEDQDEAWVDVIRGIKTLIQEFEPVKTKAPSIVKSEGVRPSASILDWLEDTEIALTHRKVDRVQLSDIYTVPDVEVDDESSSELRNYRSACRLPKAFNRFLVFGEEQQGKTSILKYYYREFLKESMIPLIINGSEIKDANPEAILRKELARQFEDLSFEEFDISENIVVMLSLIHI